MPSRQRDARLQIVAARLLLPVDDHAVGDAGGLVQHLAHRHALDEVEVVRDAFALGDDRQRVGIPLRQLLALGHLGAVIGQQLGAIGHAVAGPLAARLVAQHHLAIAAHDDGHALAVDDHVAVLDRELGIEGGFHARLLGAALDGAADVEGPHGELGARLADRLGRDDAHRLADVDGGAAGKIAPVAGRADAVLGLAGQHRADHDQIDAGPVDRLDLLLVDQLAGAQDAGPLERLDDVDGRRAAEDALAERGDDLAAFDHRLHLEAAGGAAIELDDDGVLGDVDQAARQIAGVGRLQRRVGEALAGAVGRVEVLENRQALLEVGDDRRLDDLARRLGHQAAHAGELLDLGRRAAGAGMGHHVDRVDAGCRTSSPTSPSSSRRRPARCSSTRRRPPCCTSRPG